MDPQTSKQQEKPKGVLFGLRTYASDMAEAVRSKQASVIKIALAEQKKKEEVTQFKTIERKSNTLFIILSLVFISAGVIALLWYMKATQKTEITVTPGTVSGIISATIEKKIDITSKTPDALKKEINLERTAGSHEDDSIEKILFVQNTNTAISAPVEIGTLFTALGITVPGSLLRSFSPEYMYGLYTKNEAHPFLIIKTTSYDQAFPGMLAWEKTIATDIAPFFTEEGTVSGGTQSFTDKIIQNKDARVLLRSDGGMALVYLFLNDNTIVVADTIETVMQVLSKFTQAQIRQ